VGEGESAFVINGLWSFIAPISSPYQASKHTQACSPLPERVLRMKLAQLKRAAGRALRAVAVNDPNERALYVKRIQIVKKKMLDRRA